jgi:hypothetical protein
MTVIPLDDISARQTRIVADAMKVHFFDKKHTSFTTKRNAYADA